MSIITSRRSSVTPAASCESLGCGDDSNGRDSIRVGSVRVRRSESGESQRLPSVQSILTQERDRLQWELDQAKQQLQSRPPPSAGPLDDVISELRHCIAGAKNDIRMCNSNSSNMRLTRAEEMLSTVTNDIGLLIDTYADQESKNSRLVEELSQQVQMEEEQRMKVAEQLRRLISNTSEYLGEIKKCLVAPSALQPAAAQELLAPPQQLPTARPPSVATLTPVPASSPVYANELARVKQKISNIRVMAAPYPTATMPRIKGRDGPLTALMSNYFASV
eukprot:TRINITY_DN19036_c0_g1_i1.p1 TRINITY_DN19036_c0_g1~~TRINITY_DN19036_c0_g1_i1.p1  ORF type:complete len:288 (+),score=68.79 TRINITY_DN19036_c0_g1_i1:34-864(+)